MPYSLRSSAPSQNHLRTQRSLDFWIFRVLLSKVIWQFLCSFMSLFSVAGPDIQRKGGFFFILSRTKDGSWSARPSGSRRQRSGSRLDPHVCFPKCFYFEIQLHWIFQYISCYSHFHFGMGLKSFPPSRRRLGGCRGGCSLLPCCLGNSTGQKQKPANETAANSNRTARRLISPLASHPYLQNLWWEAETEASADRQVREDVHQGQI